MVVISTNRGSQGWGGGGGGGGLGEAVSLKVTSM